MLPGGRLLAGTVGGLHISVDGGADWTRRSGGRSIAVARHAVRGRRVVLATEGAGVWLSEDGGDNFRPPTAA